MEWIESTGKTLADAVEKALDMLGVDDENLEYEVVTEAKGGFLGLGRSDARIRARVKPMSREKPGDRRRDRRRSGRKSEGAKSQGKAKAPAMAAARTEATPSTNGTTDGGSESGGAPKRRRRGGRGRGNASATETQPTGDTVTTDLSIDEQADAAGNFVAGFLDAFEMDAQVDTVIEEDSILVDVQGSDLGLLVGPKGATLAALEELTRAVVLHRGGGSGARINVDVVGYRAKRREALAGFARQLAEKVQENGVAQALEPMSAADRKVVHDTVAEIDGVNTISEGEDARRRVVIVPA
jgi:spoIIIJ-associated protein